MCSLFQTETLPEFPSLLYIIPLYSMIADLNEAKRRTLTYNFSSLKGIIFGIGTPDNDKLKIIETIHKKCKENKRTDFEFFQAYYCHETGDIQKEKLHPKLSI